MLVRELKIAGALEFTPVIHGDSRGAFLEQYRFEPLEERLGEVPQWLQTNVSVSHRGVVRGIHYSVGVPGQAKYVTVVAGRAVDFVVDLRVGSPTFGAWDAVELDAEHRRAVYIPAGLGHAFAALEDDTALHYLCSAVYDPETEFAINPRDPRIGLELPIPDAIFSERDEAAPSLDEALELGRLVRVDAEGNRR